jgi:hypothetical protein
LIAETPIRLRVVKTSIVWTTAAIGIFASCQTQPDYRPDGNDPEKFVELFHKKPPSIGPVLWPDAGFPAHKGRFSEYPLKDQIILYIP